MNHILILIVLSTVLTAANPVKIGNGVPVFGTTLPLPLNANEEEKESSRLFFLSHPRHLAPDQVSQIENNYGFTLKSINGGLYYAYGTPGDVSRYLTQTNTSAIRNKTFVTAAPAEVTNKYANDMILENIPAVSKNADGELLLSLHAIVDIPADELETLYQELSLIVLEKSAPGIYHIQIAPTALSALLQRPETLYLEPERYPLGINPIQNNNQRMRHISSFRNLIAAKQSHVDALWSEPYNLSGSGVKVGVIDGGEILTTHQEFQDAGVSRVVDHTDMNTTSSHSTHVAGTIGAKGLLAGAHGMANGVTIHGYFYNETSDSASIQTMIDNDGIFLSNHSYGVIYSYVSSNNLFGHYSAETQSVDAKIAQYPNHLFFKSAGNDRDDYDYDHNDGWDDNTTLDSWGVISMVSTAKNAFVIAAADNENQSHYWYTYKDLDSNGSYDAGEPRIYFNPTAGDYTQSDPGIAYFSTPGPTGDGRIKPDLAADGYDLNSPDNTGDDQYTSKNGTSMASPAAAGSAALILQAYRNLHGAGSFMRSDMMKALLINTATDAGRAGPDYEFGYGIINTKAAVDLLQEDNASARQLLSAAISDQATDTYMIILNDTTELNVSLAWVDPAGDPVLQSDLLINDLDLYIEDENATRYYPWSLDKNNPTALATNSAANRRDNALKIQATLPAGTYYVKVFGYEVTGSQDYALVLNHRLNHAPESTDAFFTIDEDTNKSFSADDFNFTDADMNDTLAAIYITTPVSAGTMQLNDNAITPDQRIAAADIAGMRFIPDPNAYATPYATFGFVVNDGEANSTAAYTATINVNPVADAPTLDAISDQNRSEDFSEYNLTMGAYDADGDPISYSAASSDTGVATVMISDGILIITPVANAYGSAVIEVNATANAQTATQSFTLYVSAVDDAPQFLPIAMPASKEEDFADFVLTLAATDAENDPYSFSVYVNTPGIANADLNGSQLTLSAVADAFGPFSIDINVTQESNSTLVETRTLGFTVNPVNDAPLIHTAFDNITFTPTDTNSTLTVVVSDTEGDLLTLSADSNDSSIVITDQNWSNPLNAATYGEGLIFDIIKGTHSGIALITVFVTDSDKNSTKSFEVYVEKSNELNPSIIMYLLN